jgi:hypothetical protein
VLVAESGSANTKGAWTELIASTGFDAEAIAVRIEGPNSAKTIAVDIGIGVTDSEVVLIPDIISSAGLSAGSAQNGPFCVFPLSIKAGTRISVRSQSSTTPSNDLRCAVYLIGQGFNRSSGLALVDTYGVTTTSATNGTVYDPGGTADTKGGWTQIVASTTRDISALMIIATNNENAAMTNAGWFTAWSTSSNIQPVCFGPFPVDIPKASRLSINAQCQITDATDRLLEFALYGLVG